MSCDWNNPEFALKSLHSTFTKIKQIKTILNVAFISSFFLTNSDSWFMESLWKYYKNPTSEHVDKDM